MPSILLDTGKRANWINKVVFSWTCILVDRGDKEQDHELKKTGKASREHVSIKTWKMRISQPLMKLSVRGMLQTEEPASTSTETCEKCIWLKASISILNRKC